jgi:hypothetical protein
VCGIQLSVGLSTHHAFCSYELQGKDVIFAGDDEGNIHMYVSCEVAREIAPFGSGSARQHRWSLPGCDPARPDWAGRHSPTLRMQASIFHARTGAEPLAAATSVFKSG